MKQYIVICMISVIMFGCSQQSNRANGQSSSAITKEVGGPCEGCEAIFESPVPFEKLSWETALPDFNEPGPKMVISGVIYKADGKTPAKDVVLYVYHTDQTGHYSLKGNETGWGKRHGYIRGWVKTNALGQYKFYTLKPVAYPGKNPPPAHIHPIIKEPTKNEYWIDEYLFDDDPLLTTEIRNKGRQHGGSGIIKLKKENGILVGERNIILGLNIPDYPNAK